MLFEDWIKKNFPDKANKVLNQIKTMHGGNLNDSQFGRRMRGDGKFAELIRMQFHLARAKFMKDRKMPGFNFELYELNRNPQLNLF